MYFGILSCWKLVLILYVQQLVNTLKYSCREFLIPPGIVAMSKYRNTYYYLIPNNPFKYFANPVSNK